MKSIINDTIKALQAFGLFLMWGLFAAGMLAVFGLSHLGEFIL